VPDEPDGFTGGFSHAVVVVGIGDRGVELFDPLAPSRLSTYGLTVCTVRDFEAAWLGGYFFQPV